MNDDNVIYTRLQEISLEEWEWHFIQFSIQGQTLALVKDVSVLYLTYPTEFG